MFAFIHILAGTIALISGGLSFAVTKGSPLHKRSGTVFVVSMILMAASGALLAFLATEALNMVAGLVTLYLVVTAYFTVHPLKSNATPIQALIMLFGFVVGTYAIYTGVRAFSAGMSEIDGNPVQVIIVFGSVAFIAALLDLRLLIVRRLPRKWQLVRHIWRIGFAMFIATASFFLGQSQFIPESLRNVFTLVGPVLLVLILTVYWVVRVSVWGFRSKPRL